MRTSLGNASGQGRTRNEIRIGGGQEQADGSRGSAGFRRGLRGVISVIRSDKVATPEGEIDAHGDAKRIHRVVRGYRGGGAIGRC